MKKKQIIITLLVITGIVLAGYVFVILEKIDQGRQESAFAVGLLEGVGMQMNDAPDEYSEKFVDMLVGKLVTRKEISEFVSEPAKPNRAHATLYDYSENGGNFLSLQKSLHTQPSIHMSIGLDRIEAIESRHKKLIGSSLLSWEIIKKESTYPNEPFKRVYVLVQYRGESARMKGLLFYEGSKIEIEYQGLVNDETINDFVDLTWMIADRHVDVYNMHLKEISEGPLFVDNPIFTWPDIPDPDIITSTSTEKQSDPESIQLLEEASKK